MGQSRKKFPPTEALAFNQKLNIKPGMGTIEGEYERTFAQVSAGNTLTLLVRDIPSQREEVTLNDVLKVVQGQNEIYDVTEVILHQMLKEKGEVALPGNESFQSPKIHPAFVRALLERTAVATNS